MTARLLRYLLVGFGSTTALISLLVTLHPIHFWIGVATLLVGLVLTKLSRTRNASSANGARR